MELTADVFKACRKYEKIIGDDVHFYVSTDENVGGFKPEVQHPWIQ